MMNKPAVQRGMLKCRYVYDDAQRVSYQIVNSPSGNTLCTHTQWFDNKEAAIDDWYDACNLIIKNVETHGGKLIYKDETNLVFEVYVDWNTLVAVALVQKPSTNEYGIAVYMGDELQIEPERWFATPEEACNFYDNTKEGIAEKLRELGFINVTLGSIDKMRPVFHDASVTELCQKLQVNNN